MLLIILAFLFPILNTILWGAIMPAEGHYYFRKKLLLWEETYIGAGVGISASILVFWPLMVIVAPITGLLWAYGGAKGISKGWRRLGVGVVIALIGLFNSLWVLLTVLTMFIATGFGYGIPCENDKGSLIGMFWYKKTNHNEKLSNILTRATVGLLYGLALLPLIIKRRIS